MSDEDKREHHESEEAKLSGNTNDQGREQFQLDPTVTYHAVGFIGKHSDKLIVKVSKHQLLYSILGLVLGLVCIIGGTILFFVGVTGAMSWTAKFLGSSSEILDAAPGAILFVVGLFIVFITRYQLKSKRFN